MKLRNDKLNNKTKANIKPNNNVQVNITYN